MTRLICIKNPAIIISAPDELVSEVGGNCWQIGGPQPLTYPKHLWKKESQPSLPSNLDEAAEEFAESIWKEMRYELVYDNLTECFKAGAEWMAGQSFPRWRNIDEEKPKQGEACACIIVTIHGHIKFSNFEDGPWWWDSEAKYISTDNEKGCFIEWGYGEEETHICSYWMPWDELFAVLEKQFKEKQ